MAGRPCFPSRIGQIKLNRLRDPTVTYYFIDGTVYYAWADLRNCFDIRKSNKWLRENFGSQGADIFMVRTGLSGPRTDLADRRWLVPEFLLRDLLRTTNAGNIHGIKLPGGSFERFEPESEDLGASEEQLPVHVSKSEPAREIDLTSDDGPVAKAPAKRAIIDLTEDDDDELLATPVSSLLATAKRAKRQIVD